MAAYGLDTIAYRYLAPSEAALLNGIILGIDLDKKTELYRTMLAAGLIHIAVISGMNLRLIEETITNACYWIPLRFRILFTLSTIVLFSLLVGIEPPIFRAISVIFLEKIGLWFGRKSNSWVSLLISALVGLVWEPSWLSSLSFALTYAATCGVLLVNKPSTRHEGADFPFRKVFLSIVDELRISLGACLGTAPILYYFFGRIQFISVISTPLVGWALLPITFGGFAMILMSFVSDDAAETIAYGVSFLLNYVQFVADVCARIS